MVERHILFNIIISVIIEHCLNRFMSYTFVQLSVASPRDVQICLNMDK